MVLTKNLKVALEKGNGKEIEEEEEKSESIGEGNSDSEETKTGTNSEPEGDEGDTEEGQQPHQLEVQSDGESEAPEPREMYIRRSEYTKTVKLSGKCNIKKTVATIEEVLVNGTPIRYSIREHRGGIDDGGAKVGEEVVDHDSLDGNGGGGRNDGGGEKVGTDDVDMDSPLQAFMSSVQSELKRKRNERKSRRGRTRVMRSPINTRQHSKGARKEDK